jgi:DNA replication protein DnaC
MLDHYLKVLKLPTFLKCHQEVAEQCREKGANYTDFLLHLSEMEVLGRHSRMVQQKLKKARFPSLKTLDSFDFKALPTLEQRQVRDLAANDYIGRHENIIALGNSGTGKTHIAIALGMAACQKGISVLFTTAAALVHELLEAHEARQLLRLQKKLTTYPLLIIDELGFVPFSKTGAELLFEIISNRYECSSIIVTSNLPFQEWTQVFGCERLTGALLDRLTHHVHILEMNGESYRLNHSKQSHAPPVENAHPE